MSQDLQNALDAFLDYSTVSRVSIEAFPEWKEWVLEQATVSRGFGRMQIEVQEASEHVKTLREKLNQLRRFKRREMLRIGFRDWTQTASLVETFAELSQLAELCIQQCAELTWNDTKRRLGDPSTPYLILGLGKLGGNELNYSSDVDLILVYGEEGDVTSHLTRHDWFQRWGSQFLTGMTERTEEGYLFRTDMRLRPDGNAGPLVRSLESCENYYAAFGETWERLALMKARRVAGDDELAYAFKLFIQPFCYPKHLGEEVLEEVAHIKNRIETELLNDRTRYTDVKRGTGGIREIEFIFQVHQLLNAGRHAYLQQSSTLAAMKAFESSGLIDREAIRQLREAYFFWRRIEHRIQMIEELQTHEIPESPELRWEMAASLGFSSLESFEKERESQSQQVRFWFNELVRFDAKDGKEPNPEIWSKFSPDAQRLVDNLRNGPEFINLSPRTKQLFARLEPLLYEELKSLASPEDALIGLERFVERYGSRGYLYETWLSNPRVLTLLLQLFDASQRFRDLLTVNPDWLESICREGDIDNCWTRQEYEEDSKSILTLDELRLWRWEQGLRIAIQDVLRLITTIQRESQHTCLAQVCVQRAIELGSFQDLVVMAAGKFGGWELSYGSDLDLVFVEGDRSSAIGLMSALSKTTVTGNLYSVDLRLRPEGEKGILTPSLESTLEYYRTRAQTWEFMAFTKFRPVFGASERTEIFFKNVEHLWSECGRSKNFLNEVMRMRSRIEEERDKDIPNALRIKTGTGGIVDVEFGIQSWQMKRNHPQVNTRLAIQAMAKEFPREAEELMQGYEFLRDLESVLRRADFHSANYLPLQKEEQNKLAHRMQFQDWTTLIKHLSEVRQMVRASYDRLMQQLQN